MSNHIARPRWISVTVGLLFAAGIFNILVAFTGATARYGMFYPAVQVLTTIGFVLALSGIWEMERWGLILLPVILLISLGIDLYLEAFRYPVLAVWLPLPFFWFRRKMFK
jgi:hypothetical protein